MKEIVDRVVYDGGIFWKEANYVKVLMDAPYDDGKLPKQFEYAYETVTTENLTDGKVHVNVQILEVK